MGGYLYEERASGRGPGPEDSRATPLGGMDHGTVMARVHVEFGQVRKSHTEDGEDNE